MQKTIETLEAQVAEFMSELPKVKAKGHGWKAAAARMRKQSLELEKSLKAFRKTSVLEAKE